MKRVLVLFIVFPFLLFSIVACSNSEASTSTSNDNDQNTGLASQSEPAGPISKRASLGRGYLNGIVWNDAGLFAYGGTGVFQFDPADLSEINVWNMNRVGVSHIDFDQSLSRMSIFTPEIGPGRVNLRIVDLGSGIVSEPDTRGGRTYYAGAFVPNQADQIATLDRNGNVSLIDMEAGEEIIEQEHAHLSGFGVVGYLPDGSAFLSRGEFDIIAWAPDISAEIAEIKPENFGRISTAKLSPDGKTLLMTSGVSGDAVLIDSTSYEEVPFLATRGESQGILTGALTDEVVALGYFTGGIKLFDKSGEEQLTIDGHDARVVDLTISPDGTQLASISYDGTVRIWDTETGEELAQTAGFYPQIYDISIDTESQSVASTSSQGAVTVVWNVDEQSETGVFIDPEPCCGINFESVALAPGADTVYVMTNDQENFLREVSVADGEFKEIEKTVFGAILNKVIVHEDMLALSSGGGILILVDRNTYEEIARTELENITDISFNLDGSLIAVAQTKGPVLLLNTSDLSEQASYMPTYEYTVTLRAIAAHPEQETIAVGITSVNVFISKEGEESIIEMSGNFGPAALAYNDDGSLLVIGHGDGKISLMDTNSDRVIVTVDTAHQSTIVGIGFLPDGTIVSAGSDGVIKVWDVNLD